MAERDQLDVRLAAMMPASRAVWSGSPFLIAPARISGAPPRDIRMRPRATASRAVTALSPTSTIRRRAVSVDAMRGDARSRGLRLPVRRRVFSLPSLPPSLREEERQALERDGQVDALQLHVRRHLQRAGREVQDRLDARRDDRVDDGLGRLRRARR